MSRLIDAELLKEHISSYTGMFTDEGFYVDLHAVLYGIDFQPTVQPQGIGKDRLIEELTELGWIDDDPENSFGSIKDIINQQPTTDGWIPVSERLPVNTDNVLITTQYGVVLMAFIGTSKKWYSVDGRGIDSQDTPVAWQPLPQPYKESE